MKNNLKSFLFPNTFVHFDLDGTLLDTSLANISAYQEVVASHGGRWTSDATNSLMTGQGARDFLNKCTGFESTAFDSIIAEKKRIYPMKFHLVKPNREVLDFLEASSPRAACVTSASKSSTLALLENFKIMQYFSHVVSADDVKSVKPAPDCYLLSRQLAEEKFGVELTHCAVEDSIVGKKAAEAAGIKVLDVNQFF